MLCDMETETVLHRLYDILATFEILENFGFEHNTPKTKANKF